MHLFRNIRQIGFRFYHWNLCQRPVNGSSRGNFSIEFNPFLNKCFYCNRLCCALFFWREIEIVNFIIIVIISYNVHLLIIDNINVINRCRLNFFEHIKFVFWYIFNILSLLLSFSLLEILICFTDCESLSCLTEFLLLNRGQSGRVIVGNN